MNREGFTIKGFITGCILSILIGVGNIYVWAFRGGSPMAHDHYAPLAIFLLLVLVGVNLLLRRISEKLTFSTHDLILIYIMMLVACSLPGRGNIIFLPASISAPFYYASPENKWAEVVIPHIRSWLSPQNIEAIKYFFEGLPRGGKIPWGVWIGPILHWFLFLLVLHFVMICIAVMLRKQWVENERLVYPLTYLPKELANQPKGSILPSILKNKLMWIGFAIPFVVGLLRGLHFYFPFIPTIHVLFPFDFLESLGIRYIPRMWMFICFATIGFMYLIPSRISFGIWFLSLAYFFQQWFLGLHGLDIDVGRLDIYATELQSGAISLQGTGAVVFLMFSVFWMSREHLRDVFYKAIGKSKHVDDSNEILPYPVVFWGILLGIVFMIVWLSLTGIPVYATIFFLVVTFGMFIGITKLVCEGGIIISRFPVLPASIVTNVVGSSALGPSGVVGLTYTWIWAGDVRTFVQVPAALGLKMTEGYKKPRLLFWAMMLASILCTIAAIWAIITITYKHGGINMRDFWVYSMGQRYAYDFAAYQIQSPIGTHWGSIMFIGFGVLIMAILSFMHYRFLWWPIHPLAFPATTILFIREHIIPIFIAWVLKVLIVRFGGAKVYRESIPFFLGLILGQFFIAGIWLIVDAFTGRIGNWIFHRG